MHKKSAYRQLNWRKARRSLPRLLAGIGMLFVSVGVIAGILYSVAGLQVSQDLRRDASSEVAYQLFLSDTDIQVTSKNADGISITALLFADDFLLTNQSDITYTWSAADQNIVSLAPKSYPAGSSCPENIAAPCPALRLEIKPLSVGATTIRVVAERNGVQVDSAETQIAVVERIDGTRKAASTPFEDLFFVPSEDSYARIFSNKEKSRIVDPHELESGEKYWFEYRFTLNNIFKSKVVSKQTLVVAAETNTDIHSSEISYDQLASTTTGKTVSGFVEFTARDTNEFRFLIDANERYAEADENNNSINVIPLSRSQDRQRNGENDQNRAQSDEEDDTVVQGCNQSCSSNGDCAAGLTCTDLGDAKRCRNPQNTQNTSCNGTTSSSSGSGNKSCNESCSNASDCTAGLTCWYNKCRNPQFLDSTSCSTARGGIQATQQEVVGCNLACASNRDCANGLRCYQNTCRYPLNPTSPSCSPQTAAGTTKGGSSGSTANTGSSGGTLLIPSTPSGSTPSSTPRPLNTTATSSAEASPTPAATPTATPVPPAEETALDTLSLTIGSYLDGLFSADSVAGIPVPIFVIGLGILFLLIAVVIIVVSSLRKRGKTSIKHSSDLRPHKSSSSTPIPFTPAGAVTPPPAPGKMQQARQQHTLHSIQTRQQAGTPQAVEQITRPGENNPVAGNTQIARPAPAQPVPPVATQQQTTPLPPTTRPQQVQQTPAQAAPAPTQTTQPADSSAPTTSDPAQKKPSSLVERLKQKGIDVPAKPNS